MSLKDVIERLNDLNPKIDRLFELLSKFEEQVETLNQNTSDPHAIAAKVINDISDKIDEKDCCDKILEAIKSKQGTGQELIPKAPEPSANRFKYSFPNWNVGNANLGSSVDPDALVWPPVRKE